jgi:hypothetical protein
VCIYIYRERERERELKKWKKPSKYNKKNRTSTRRSGHCQILLSVYTKHITHRRGKHILDKGENCEFFTMYNRKRKKKEKKKEQIKKEEETRKCK